jgi:hypothetical protein
MIYRVKITWDIETDADLETAQRAWLIESKHNPLINKEGDIELGNVKIKDWRLMKISTKAMPKAK